MNILLFINPFIGFWILQKHFVLFIPLISLKGSNTFFLTQTSKPNDPIFVWNLTILVQKDIFNDSDHP